jgi:hypothetical protein
MTFINRGALWTFALAVLFALAFQLHPTRAGNADGPIAVAMVTAPLGNDVLAPPLAEPALVCYPKTVYVLPQNCYKACLNQGHSPAECRKRAVLCQSCWRQFLTCTSKPGLPVPIRCEQCSVAYAECVKPFGGPP